MVDEYYAWQEAQSAKVPEGLTLREYALMRALAGAERDLQELLAACERLYDEDLGVNNQEEWIDAWNKWSDVVARLGRI